jgi:superfamily II DNA or RNA helicase
MNLLSRKAIRANHRGLDSPPHLASHLFPFQAACVDFLLQIGSGGLFLDTGLGKTACELEWCRHAAGATNGRALILTPLAVAQQIAREGERWGYNCRVIREASESSNGIDICNYDRLAKIDPSSYGAVALDESSILKNFTGKTSRALIQAFSRTRFRLSATATPAPNDHMELGQHSDFCGVMASNEMLSRFFINDASTASQHWRLKGHAVEAFWDWMASWCRMATLPSDLGYSDEGFVLPALNTFHHGIESKLAPPRGSLFASSHVSATDMHHIKRQTAQARAECAAEIVDSAARDPWVIWCDTDYEANAITRALAVVDRVAEVRGSHSIDRKEEALAAFLDGDIRVVVTKPSVCGFGLNWQHCAHTIFVGRSFSYEKWYQAIRRLWRFGQKRPVECHVIIAAGEETIGRVIDRKAGEHKSMKDQMAVAMRRAMETTAGVRLPYRAEHEGRLPAWI